MAGLRREFAMIRPSLLVVSAFAFVVGCKDARQLTGPRAPNGPAEIISDGAHGGNRDFFFLPPMVPLAKASDGFELGKFNNTLQPSLKIEICELAPSNLNAQGRPGATTPCIAGAPLKTFAPGSVSLVNLPRGNWGWWSYFNLPPDGFYYVLWNTRQSNLDVNKYYRIKVLINGSTEPLGVADVDPLSSLRQWQYSATGEVVQMVDDTYLPIPFRVEKGAFCEDATLCGSATLTNDNPNGDSQVLQVLSEEGVPVAGVLVPDGWLPEGGPQSVVFTITRVNTGVSDVAAGTQTNKCHANLQLQQFDGCFHFSTIPELPIIGPNGKQFAKSIIGAVCFVLHDTDDPREPYVQLWSSEPGEEGDTPIPLKSADASAILTDHEGTNCGESDTHVATTSSNVLTRFASAGWRQVANGFGRVLGVRTAYAVDLGLGGILDGISNIGPALTAELQAVSEEESSVSGTESKTITTRIVGTRIHDGTPLGAVTAESKTRGIPGLPVTYTVSAGNGGLLPLVSEGEVEAVAQMKVSTSPVLEDPLSGGLGSVRWKLPAEPGTYTLTATGPTTGGPVIFTATVSAPIPDPVLVFEWSEMRTVENNTYVIYNLDVTNYQAYPAEMFAPAPDLPPCGLNTNASRTWVDIYDASSDNRIYGFCGLGSPADLRSIWFGIESGAAQPSQVYIKLMDRATGLTYRSNDVAPVLPDLVVSSGAPSLTPATVTSAGGTLMLSPWTVTNQGGTFHTSNGVLYVRSYVSTDATITDEDTPLRTATVVAEDVEAGESSARGAESVTIPALPPGTYYIGILADYSGVVAESSEANNFVSAPFVVTSAAPHLAFISSPLEGCCANDVYMQRIDGTDRVRLTQQPTAGEFRPRWSPDGSVILFARNGNLYTINPETKAEALLASNADQGNYSPDGTKIVFTRGFRLWQMNAAGGQQVQLSTAGMDQGVPSFAPDNATIVYMGQGAGQNIFRRDPSGEEIQLTTDNVSTYPSFSPDGTTILYQSGKTIYSMARDGTGQAPVRAGSIINGQSLWPTYAPDGNTITFIRQQTNSHELYLMNSDGHSVRAIVGTPDAIENYPSIRPGNRSAVGSN